MNNRDILIFDEPASMIDPIAEMEQFVGIKNLLGGRTAILISHRVGFARMADRIIMLDNGAIAEMGTHDELISKGGLYAHFFREQAQWYDKETAPIAGCEGLADGFFAEGIPATDTELTEAEKPSAKPDNSGDKGAHDL